MRRMDEKELVLTLERPCSHVPPALAAWDCTLGPTGRLAIRYRPSRAQVGQILDAVRDAGLVIRDLQTREADLEEVFIRLTGHGTEPPAEAAP